MFIIAIMFLGFIIFLVATIKIGSRTMGYFIGKMVSEKHKAAEEIINTGNAPKNWTDTFQEMIVSLHEPPINELRIEKIKKKAKKNILKKLKDIIKYFTKSPCFENEEVRKELLETLKNTYSCWEKNGWESILSTHKNLKLV